jgi:LmbE family N-acetylglucosaminyl deacetylase
LPIDFNRPLIFVAHPDDETIACAGLLQRMTASLVVFATDGAPPHYGFKHKFGTLEKYSTVRFQEAARALGHVPSCSFQRLTKPDGSYFVDQHLFHDLDWALGSMCRIARSFSPDVVLCHAYEGGHIDHDTCSFIAMHCAAALSLRRFEFPLYWEDENGKSIVQQFRDGGTVSVEWSLTAGEIACKEKMLGEYKSQAGLASAFPLSTERIRPATYTDFSVTRCRHYSYRDWWRTRLSPKVLLKKFAQFEARQVFSHLSA